MTSSGGNIQLTQPTSGQAQTSTASTTPISLPKNIILNPTTPNRVAIPIVLTNQIDTGVAQKKLNQTTPNNKVTLQSFKSLIDKPTPPNQSTNLTNATVAVKAAANIYSLILNNSNANQSKPVVTTLNNTSSPKIVVNSTKSSSSTAATIAQLCANLNNNTKQSMSNSTPQQLISQIIPQTMRLISSNTQTSQQQQSAIPTSLLVNSTTSSNSSSSCNSNQSPSSSPLKPNIIRKARRDSPSSHSNLLQNSDHVYNHQAQSTQPIIKHPVFELNVDSFKALSQIPIPTALLPTAQNLISLSDTPVPHHQQQQQQQLQPAQYLSIPSSSLISTSSTSASPSSSTTSIQSMPKSISTVINEALIESSITTSTKSQTIRKMTQQQQASRAASPTPQPTSSSQASDSTTIESTRKRRKQEFKKQNLDTLLNPNPLASLTDSTKTKIKNSEDECDEQQEPLAKIPRVSSQLLKTDKKRMHTIKIKDCETEEAFLDDETVELLSKEFSYVDRDGVKWTTKRQRSQYSIGKFYCPNWKPKHNHFVKYTDVSLSSSNPQQQQSQQQQQQQQSTQTKTITRKELVDNLNEWKFHYVISQVNSLIDYENESLDVMNDVENFLKNPNFFGFSDICFKISESIKANSQRHKYINEQLDETQLLIHKLFEHKEKYKNYLIISSNGGASNSCLNTQSSTNQSLPSQTGLCTKKGLKKSFKSPHHHHHSFKNINTRTNNLKIKETKIKTK